MKSNNEKNRPSKNERKSTALSAESFASLVDALKARRDPGTTIEWMRRLGDWLARPISKLRNRMYVAQLLKRGRAAIAFKDELGLDACVALILARIKDGGNTRDNIESFVPRYSDFAYPMVSYILDELTGDDPMRHLWVKDKDGKYRLLPI